MEKYQPVLDEVVKDPAELAQWAEAARDAASHTMVARKKKARTEPERAPEPEHVNPNKFRGINEQPQTWGPDPETPASDGFDDDIPF